MGMRLQLAVVGKPHMTKTFLKCGTFDARDLRHVINKDELEEIFRGGAGINLDFFTEKGVVNLKAEGRGPIHFNSEVMLPGKKYPLRLNEKGILKIGDLLLHAKVLKSNFDHKHQ